jgi:hypothetical protein
MANPQPTKDDVLEAIRRCTAELGHPPSRKEFESLSGIRKYWVAQHFNSWRDAQRAAGVQPHMANIRLTDDELLADWGRVVRQHREIPTRDLYRREGEFSPGVFEKHFGPWSALPGKFRTFAKDKAEWADVLVLVPEPTPRWQLSAHPVQSSDAVGPLLNLARQSRHSKLADRPVVGNPIDFRGLRHEPVNEQGVVFLFGMVAKELGYMVEAVQTGYPDCEAKRQVGPDNWQAVRIEFEFESNRFNHPPDGCDVIVCWRHNWPECPPHLEVVELSSVIKTLGKSDD